MSAMAYERVVFNAGTGYSTTTFGASTWMKSGATTLNGYYYIDCKALGIAEIASTTVSLYVDSSTRSGFNIFDFQSGKLSNEAYTITNTATDFSYTFTPPIWCKDSFVLLGGEEYATRPVLWSTKGASNVDQVPHAWCWGTGSSCSMSELRGEDIAIIAEGTWATSSEPSGGGTTTYSFYTATTSPAESINELTTVILTFALVMTLALSAVLSYHFTYGRRSST